MSDNRKYSILFLCARPIGTVEKSICASALVDLDWQELIVLAKQQGMMSLLYGHLKYHELLDAIPDFAQEALHRFFILNVARNERLQKLLLQVLAILKSAKIDVTPIKGLILAKELYGDIAWRTMEDLDFLVPLPDMLSAREELLKNGFIDSLDIRDSDIEQYINAGWDLSFLHQDSGMLVQIGAGISPRYMGFNKFGPELFTDQREIILSDTPVATLSPEAQFILLSIHGTKHYWNRVAWLSDLGALLCRYPDLDLVRIERLSRDMGIWRMILISFYLNNILLGTELPSTIEVALTQDSHARKLAERMAVRVSMFEPLTSRQYRHFYIMTLDRLMARMRYLVDLTFSPTFNDWKVISLPHHLRALYYVIRPFRMVCSWFTRQKARRSL